MIRARDRWWLEDLGSRNGTFLEGERIVRQPLAPGAMFDAGRALFCFEPALPGAEGAADLDSEERGVLPPGLRSLLPELEARGHAFLQVASTRVPLVLRGESGTGRHLAARAAHERSGRSGPLITAHGGALQGHTAEQLFGRGPSPEAPEEPGLLRAAHQGTLYLEEPQELARPLQAALLGAIEARQVLPVGSSRGSPADVRLIVAPHQRQEQPAPGWIEQLSGYVMELPALRHRRADLGVLLAQALARSEHPGARQATLDIELARALWRHRWPHNGRELRQFLEAGLALAPEGHLGLNLAPWLATSPPEDEAALRASLERALERAGGNVTEVARQLGKGPTQIHRWLRRFAIDPSSFRGGK
jgi:DNA-binding NtrC family response regulator